MNPPQAHHLDVRFLACPLPLLKTKKALALMNEGETLSVVFSDEQTLLDIKKLCQTHQHTLLEVMEQCDKPRPEMKAVIRK